MLDRIRPNKDDEERRLLDGFLARLSLEPDEFEKSERPDFFLRFERSPRSVRIACEVVRFHLETEGPTRLDHGHRWRSFAVRLREELRRSGQNVAGVLYLRGGSSGSFEALLRRRDRTIAEISNLLRRTGVTSGTIVTFDVAEEPVLSSAVDRILLRPANRVNTELWWCSSLQSGVLPDPWPSLVRIVREKDAKAANWNWRNADERWLLVVAEAQTLGDTMVLTDAVASTTIPCKAFSRTFLWDGFSERIHQIQPTYGLVFEVDTQGLGIINRRTFPNAVANSSELPTGP